MLTPAVNRFLFARPHIKQSWDEWSKIMTYQDDRTENVACIAFIAAYRMAVFNCTEKLRHGVGPISGLLEELVKVRTD